MTNDSAGPSKRRYTRFSWVLMLLASLLTGCSSQLKDYQQTTPAFRLAQYFDGEVTAWGIIEDYQNQLQRHFCVDIVGTWQGNQGQLHETFYFNDGEQQIRIWQLQVAADGKVTGTAGDVVGIAEGGETGMAFNWRYELEVPIGDSEFVFFIDDWMYRLDEHRVMNRSYMKKLGVTVAEISIYFDKTPPVRRCPAGENT